MSRQGVSFFVVRNRFGQAAKLGSGNAAKCEAFASLSDKPPPGLFTAGRMRLPAPVKFDELSCRDRRHYGFGPTPETLLAGQSGPMRIRHKNRAIRPCVHAITERNGSSHIYDMLLILRAAIALSSSGNRWDAYRLLAIPQPCRTAAKTKRQKHY